MFTMVLMIALISLSEPRQDDYSELPIGGGILRALGRGTLLSFFPTLENNSRDRKAKFKRRPVK
jgi:hypothetical protein